MSLEPGTKIGPYEIVSPVGAGGMGEVYRAKDSRLGREVAVKILPQRLSQDESARARFEREAQSVAALSHPNILSIFDFGFAEDAPYAVTELLEGETLRERLSRTGLPWQKAAEIAISLAEGLGAAHAKGIVHRDLKPDNIFLTHDDRVKILDFGLARTLEPEPFGQHSSAPTAIVETQAGTVLGTMGYMSPEQVRGHPADERSDIFSLGAVLYEMLTGVRAFPGETASDVMAAILRDEVPAPADSGVAIPYQLQQIIEKALKKDPEDRFRTAGELRAELRSALGSGESTIVHPPVSGEHVAQHRMSWRPAALGLAALILVSLAIIGWAVLPLRPSGADPLVIRSLAVLPLQTEETEVDEHVDYLGDEIVQGLINRLSSVEDLRIMAWSSVRRFKRMDEADPVSISQELGVDSVLTGTVTRRGELVSIQASLIDSNGFQVWGDRFEHPFLNSEVFKEDVAQQVASRLGLQLGSAPLLASQGVRDPEAFRQYLKVRHGSKKPSYEKEAEDYAVEIEALEDAMQLDEEFLGTQKEIAKLLTEAGITGKIEVDMAMPKAKEMALKVLETDKQWAFAYSMLGSVSSRFERDWENAGKHLLQAVEMSPNSAKAWQRYAMDYLAPSGRLDEAISAMRKASRLEPDSVDIQADMGRVHYFARNYPEAIDRLAEAAGGSGSLDFKANHYLALAQIMTGDHDAAIDVLDHVLDDLEDEDRNPGNLRLRTSRFRTLAVLSLAYGRAGEEGKVRRIYRKIRRGAPGRDRPPRPPRRAAVRGKSGDDAAMPNPPSAPAATSPQGTSSPFSTQGERSRESVRIEGVFPMVPGAGSSAFWLSYVHLGLKDYDAAIESLRRAVRMRAGETIHLKIDPIFDPLRTDSRFAELLRELNLGD